MINEGSPVPILWFMCASLPLKLKIGEVGFVLKEGDVHCMIEFVCSR